MLVWGGNCGSFITTLQVCPYLVEWSLLLVWGSVGDAKDSSLSTFYMVELVGHSFFQCLEYGTSISYVVNLEGTQCPNVWGTERTMDLLKPLLTRTLFEWSRIWGIWGFTRCTSLLDFINFVSLYPLFCSDFTIVNSLYFSYQ